MTIRRTDFKSSPQVKKRMPTFEITRTPLPKKTSMYYMKVSRYIQGVS